MTLIQILKSTAVNGIISAEKAMQVAATIDQEREATLQLLKECERNVGMYIGEKINTHLATMTGNYFNERDYNYERMPGEQ